MTSRDFCYWLQGHFEISETKTLGERETDMVKRHLALVFKHEIDPSIDGADKEKAAIIQAMHDGKIAPPHGYDKDMQVRC